MVLGIARRDRNVRLLTDGMSKPAHYADHATLNLCSTNDRVEIYGRIGAIRGEQPTSGCGLDIATYQILAVEETYDEIG